MSEKDVLLDCHICEKIAASGERELCPCCDYPGCLHRDDFIEILDWYTTDPTQLPLAEWFEAEVEKRAYRPTA